MKSLSDALQDFEIELDFELKVHHWSILERLFNDKYESIKLITSTENLVPVWELTETLEGEVIFNLIRNKITSQRITKVDMYGLLGVSLLDLSKKQVGLTEGVSDYITAKLLYPNDNILGMTTLSGSTKSKLIYTTLFDDFVLLSDNDTSKEKNTGVTNTMNMRKSLVEEGKTVKVEMPDYRFKDITENFIQQLKILKFSQ